MKKAIRRKTTVTTKMDNYKIDSIHICIFLLLVSVLVPAGCENSSSEPKTQVTANADLVDNSVEKFHNLGWLGVQTYPLKSAFSFVDPVDSESSVSPGGLVVANVMQATPAEAAGLKTNDVIVGIENEWLPIKDDPTLDVMEQIETRVTSGESETAILVYRDGEVSKLVLKNTVGSVDEGLPDKVARYSDAANLGLQKLASLQNDDGSFSDEQESFDNKLQIASLAGLAFLASPNDQLKSNIDSCKRFIADQLDSQTKETVDQSSQDLSEEPEEPDPGNLASGAMMVQMPEFDMQPLTAAYVAQFLAEANVPMMDQKWMSRMLGIVGVLNRNQHESGGWNVSDSEEQVDVPGTYTTNQALLAIGMLERKGISGNPETIKKACSYLKSQLTTRAGSSIDRRVKSALTAGTGAALVAINCQPSDPVLERSIEDGLAFAGEMYSSPRLNLTGLLSVALLAKQTGNENWQRFHENNKVFLTSVVAPDGSFFSFPGNNEPSETEHLADNPIWQAAHYCLLLTMQSGNLKSFTGQTKSPMAVARNSAGEASKGGAKRPGMPPGLPGNGKMMSFTLDDLSGEGSMEDQIKEKLKEMGIDTSKIKMGSMNSTPSTPPKK